jgi:hypothetical protein
MKLLPHLQLHFFVIQDIKFYFDTFDDVFLSLGMDEDQRKSAFSSLDKILNPIQHQILKKKQVLYSGQSMSHLVGINSSTKFIQFHLT